MDRLARREIARRAASELGQRRLVVDYYRVRLRVSYPLPVRALLPPELPALRGMDAAGYPWATWLTWRLEERVHALGWHAEWSGDRAARAAAGRDLAALAEWPSHRQYDKPDLSLGHALRLLVAALRWRWPSARLRARIARGLARALDASAALVERYYAAWPRREDIVALADPRPALHNIPLIGSVGLAMAARAIGDARADALDARVASVAGALLDRALDGTTEGVAYDGYVLDFVGDWLATLPRERRAPLVGHPAFAHAFEAACRLGAPGDALAVAELSDVEPVEMTFHATAHARCLALRGDARIAWWLRRCAPERLRCAALALLDGLRAPRAARAPAAGAQDAHCALVLRSGWEARDLATAMSCTTSIFDHMHDDDGSLVIGTAGAWLIADPGYQQYLETSERGFTLGASAHNAPVIDGRAQTAKACRRLALGGARGALTAALDLTACYPAELGLTRVERRVWQVGRDLVVVGDRIAGGRGAARWHWHGHPRAAWWIADGEALIDLDGVALRVTAVGRALRGGDLARLRGSRGQRTLVVERERAEGTHWTVFSRATRREAIALDGAGLRVGARRFAMDDA